MSTSDSSLIEQRTSEIMNNEIVSDINKKDKSHNSNMEEESTNYEKQEHDTITPIESSEDTTMLSTTNDIQSIDETLPSNHIQSINTIQDESKKLLPTADQTIASTNSNTTIKPQSRKQFAEARKNRILNQGSKRIAQLYGEINKEDLLKEEMNAKKLNKEENTNIPISNIKKEDDSTHKETLDNRTLLNVLDLTRLKHLPLPSVFSPRTRENPFDFDNVVSSLGLDNQEVNNGQGSLLQSLQGIPAQQTMNNNSLQMPSNINKKEQIKIDKENEKILKYRTLCSIFSLVVLAAFLSVNIPHPDKLQELDATRRYLKHTNTIHLPFWTIQADWLQFITERLPSIYYSYISWIYEYPLIFFLIGVLLVRVTNILIFRIWKNNTIAKNNSQISSKSSQQTKPDPFQFLQGFQIYGIHLSTIIRYCSYGFRILTETQNFFDTFCFTLVCVVIFTTLREISFPH